MSAQRKRYSNITPDKEKEKQYSNERDLPLSFFLSAEMHEDKDKSEKQTKKVYRKIQKVCDL